MIFAAFTALFVGIVALIFAVNRLMPVNFSRITAREGVGLKQPGDSISVLTWNIGYAALGAGADFYVDGGRHIRALDKGNITAAIRFIANQLADVNADVLLIQETAGSSFLTRGINIYAVMSKRLIHHASYFWADFRTYLVPPPLRLRHGMAIFSRLQSASTRTLPLPQEPKFYAGFLKKSYAGLISTYPIAGSERSWVIINIHLSAFDSGAKTRNDQIRALFAFAKTAYAKGDFVVIGGDWNMRLAQTNFAHTTEDKYLFWVHDMPEHVLPSGWQWAIDPQTPTVRTMHQPYVAGETYTMVIDGFAVSPNVHIEGVATQNSDFTHTDHHAVCGQFRTRSAYC